MLNMILKKRVLLVFGMLLWGTLTGAQDKKPLDHDVYDIWNRINEGEISRNGDWALFSIGPQEKDAEMLIRSTESDLNYRIARGEKGAFSADSYFAAFLIKAHVDSVKAAKKAKKKDDQMPKDSLGIVNLSSGDVMRIPNVKSFKMPEDAGAWIAYLLEKEPAKKDTSEDKSEAKKQEKSKPSEKKNGKNKKKKAEGTTLVLRQLADGVEYRFEHAVEYALSKNGEWLIYTAASKDSTADGIFAVRAESGANTTLLTGAGDYKQIAIDDASKQVAFLSNRDEFQADQPAFSLYRWKTGEAQAKLLVQNDNEGIPAGWWLSEHGNLEFSQNGKRLFMGTAPRPKPETDEDESDDEKVKLDIWNWKDPLLQPMQLKQAKREKERSYRAVLHLDQNKLVQLATEEMPEVFLAQKNNSDVAVGRSDVPYEQEISWDFPRYYDFYMVDVGSGEHQKVAERVQTNVELSPAGKYLFWWDRDQLAWFVQSTSGSRAINVSKNIPYRLDNELHDWPYKPNSYGDAGWTKNDDLLLLYDKHDIWAVDPAGKKAPRCVTEEVGRKNDMQFRYTRLDREQRFIDPKEPMLLAAFHLTTKADGYYRDQINGDDVPKKLVMGDFSLSRLRKAKDADKLMLTRETFREFPDYWVCDLNLSGMKKLTDANPQQADYRWGTSELVAWSSVDGVPLQGILYKPDNFEASIKYPMMVYFYEKMSNGLHRHFAPGPSRSSINFSFYVSRGYLVFIPDIPYKVGYPGESAVNAVMPGVLSLIDEGFVDRDRIGVQGHSWGGYQIAYMVTRTNLFRAAEAGAPVSNMTSAYGGIRWGSGMSRMFQYERTQSRIGGSLWEYPNRYIENSPIFWADKIETPVLMMHNDEDGAVPWYQGIEFFVALRRLGKPAWLLNYNGEDHGLRKWHNQKDFAIRLQQYFDHYLLDAPVPVWMLEGVPAVQKGETLGLEPVSTNGGH